tara:strand:+ start:3359 stop:3652 length:294 start_codon:yes stop_codon:yes gene_type:complete
MIRSERGEKKIDWYVKWAASMLVMLAICARAAGPEFRDIDLIAGTVGIALWLWVSLLWEDRALILLNGVSFFVLCMGVMREFGPLITKFNLLAWLIN